MLTRSQRKLFLTETTQTPSLLLLLPEELLAQILSYLSLSEIGVICLTGSSLLRSKSWLKVVVLALAIFNIYLN